MKKLMFYDNKNTISEMLRQGRKQAGLSQGELAAKMQTIGVSLDQQAISKIENNTRIVTDFELACFCHVLRLSPEDMLKKAMQLIEDEKAKP